MIERSSSGPVMSSPAVLGNGLSPSSLHVHIGSNSVGSKSPQTRANNNKNKAFANSSSNNTNNASLLSSSPVQLAAAAARQSSSPPSSSQQLLPRRRGASLIPLTSSNMANRDATKFREALVRHDASLSRAGAAVSHLQPIDRHALTARAHFRPDPHSDSLAQHLRWSTSGNGAISETDVVTAARETYNPIAPPAPPMQLSIKQITRSPSTPESGTVKSSPMAQRPSYSQQKRFVSVENSPSTPTPPPPSGKPAQRPISSSSSPSPVAYRKVPGSAELRKQYDLYQRSVSFMPPMASSTKYFYKPEHGWLVKGIRERRHIQQQQQQEQMQQPTFSGTTTGTVSQMPSTPLEISKYGQSTPPRGSPEPLSRSSTANTPNRMPYHQYNQQQQQQRLISAMSSVNNGKVPQVTLVDFNGEHDDADSTLKVAHASANNAAISSHPVKTLRRPQLQHPDSATAISGTVIEVPHARAASSTVPTMTQSSKQHPAVRAKKLRNLFASYDDFKRAAEDYANNFPKLPDDLTASPYLNEAKQRQIWCWLHYGETINDVDYLLSVC